MCLYWAARTNDSHSWFTGEAELQTTQGQHHSDFTLCYELIHKKVKLSFLICSGSGFCIFIYTVTQSKDNVAASDLLHSLMFWLYRKTNIPERLEVDPSKHSAIDLASIVPRQNTKAGPLEASRMNPPASTAHSSCSEGFVDDPDVPPLI